MKIFSLCLCLALFGASCADKKSPQKEGPSASAQHGASGAKPGSYEDWCEEHQVLESQCTQCNPSIIAAFKVTGDWCEEHQLPESQCKKCNPALKIERPAKEE